MNSSVSTNANAAPSSGTSMGKLPILIMIAVVLLAFVAVIIYISFELKSSNLKGKQLIKQPIKIDELKSPVVVEGGDIPKSAVGREYTYSYWLYIEDASQSGTAAPDGTFSPKMIFYRGSDTSLADANPIVMMDGKTNKLYFVIKTQGSSLPVGNNTSVNNNLSNIINRSYFLNPNFTMDTVDVHKHIILSIDYIPLQRWVNVTTVIDNKIITVFMDGEIYSVKTVDEYKTSKAPEFDASNKVKDYNLIIDKTENNIFIGKFGNNFASQVNGYISNLQFFNYAVSINEVKKIYMRGPLSKNFLQLIGISSYGMRSPIYKIDEYQSVKK